MSNKKPESGLDPTFVAKAQANAAKFAKLQMRALSDSAKTLQAIEDRQAKIADLEEQIANATGKTKKALQAKLAGQQQYLKVSQQVLKQEQTRVSLTRELNDITKDIQSKYDNILDTTFDQQSASKKLTDLVKRRIQAVKENNEEEIALLSTAIEQQLAYKAQIPYLQKVQGAFNQINGIAQDLAGSITSAFDSLPGGKYLSKMLGLDKLGDAFKTSINAAGKAFIESGGNIGKTMKAFGGSLTSLLNPVTLIAAALAGAFLILKNITDQAKEFSKETGLTVASSQKLVEQSYSLQASFSNQLSSQKDILAVQQELISTLGPIAQLSGDVALRVSETGKAFGYGAQEAAKVQAQMMEIGGFSQTAAIEAQEFTAQLALAEGVAPGTVMKDIAKSAAVAAKYFSGNPKALGKAAVEAAKLGTSLDQMAKTSAALLNIEQSLEDQYVASAMLGRQINFDTARRLSAEGDIVGATQEVLKELGGIEEFENASIFAKERMAAAAGMTVEELSKSLAIEERRGELSDDQLAAMSGLNLSAAEITSMNADDLKTKLANKQATEELATSFAKIQSSLTTAILPIAKALVPVFKILAVTVDGIASAFNGIVSFIKEFKTLVLSILAIVTSIYAIENASNIAAAAKHGLFVLQYGALVVQETIQGAILAIQNSQTMSLIRQGIVMAGNLVKSIATAVAQITGMSAATLGVAAGIALAAGATAYAFLSSKEDDMVMSPTGPTGYSRVLSGPEGAVALNDNDTIVAGTNLNGGGGSGTSVISKASIDALVSAIQNLKIIIDDSAVSAINKQGAVAASYR